MFFGLALLSMTGYVLQNVLLIRYARRMNTVSLVFYRNASFVVTLLPLLLAFRPGDEQLLLQNVGWFVLAGMCGALYLAFSYEALKSLAAGSSSALLTAATTVSVLLLSIIFLGESLSFEGKLLVVVIILSAIALGTANKRFDHLDNRVVRGIVLTLLAGVPGAATKVILAQITQGLHPFVAGYFWELSIAIGSIILILLASAFRGEKLQRVHAKTMITIALCSSPTLIGTGAFALAISMGPLSLVQAISSGSSLVLMGILSTVLYREHLGFRQWIPILVIAGSIAALKLLS